jgi:hypothetical protein
MSNREPFRAAYRSRGPARMGCRIARCRFWCWARLEVNETLSGKPLCHRCWERHERRVANRIAGMIRLAELRESVKAKWFSIARARIAGTAFEPWPDQDRF